VSAFLLDVNVVLSLIDRQHVHHAAAHRWAEHASDAEWMTSPIVQNGVLRISGQPAYSATPGTRARVRRALEALCAHRRHRFCPDDIAILDAGHLARPEALASSRVTDLYLLALARRHGARLATFDRRIPADAVVDGARALTVIDA
jgi:uncharacterized protein